MQKLQDYLGDGVYAESTDYGTIILKANHHENPTDTIYLDAYVVEALNRFIARANEPDPS